MSPVVDRLRIQALATAMAAPDALARRMARVPESIDGQPLDLRTRLFLTFLQLDHVEHHTLPVATQRAEIDLASRVFAAAPEPCARAWVDVPLRGRTLRARTYVPFEEEPRGALLYLHGGGFVTGGPEPYDPLCSRLARVAGCRVFSLEYRLAPEHPFPAAADDALDALWWLREHAASFGVDPALVAIGGDSAGGNLSAATCNALGPGEQPLFQLLIYPGTDMVEERPSRATFGTGFYMSNDHVRWFYTTYAPTAEDRASPRASPIRAERLGAAPAILVLAGLDPLFDEGAAYGARLREAGVPVERLDVSGMVHGFVSLNAVLPAAEAAVARVCAAVAARFDAAR